MNKVFLIFLALLGTPAFAALPLDVKNLKGWTLQEIPSDDIAKQLTSGAAATLVRPVDGGMTVNINVHIEAENEVLKKAGENLKAWRKAIFATEGMPPKISIQKEAVVKKDGGIRYLVEYQSNTGSETMLNSVLMITVFKGKTYLFIYEGERSIYLKNAPEVKKALKEMTLAPAAT